ncbi:hypothetical protein [Pollutimonas harenae]|uniref:YqjK-like protein n=1 Tax=Pollutimonas harenae TaxID=657015 RepID=A0A853H9D3_9BURK|nr:hypothetical protein [Pollutimonas harenae]NYT87033.1 hypothetical protein [Pollutimonas harenae]TEA69250.1 hypothetical protein ERD84_15835 [Pollutimonas harenae]
MKQGLTAKERALQIELVRARAALERQSIVRGVRDLGSNLTPRSVFSSLFPRAASKSVSDWIFGLISLTRRYPLLTSGASALLSGVGKRRRLWRIGAGLLVSWQLARSLNRKPD